MTNHLGRDWSEQEIETLTSMWADGKSATDIAKVLKKRSREAVLGKVHRLKLPYNGTKKRPQLTKEEAAALASHTQRPSPPRKFSWELNNE